MIGADKNELKIDAILHLNPSLKQCVNFPTRQNSPAILDIVITDLHIYYQNPVCEDPLEVDDDKIGSPSDHFMVFLEPINAINNQRIRSKRTFNYRAYNDEAFAKMGENLDKIVWGDVFKNSSEDQVYAFQKTVFEVFDQCFPLKTKTVINESEPFFTDKLSKLRKRKQREFHKNRKSDKYLSLSKIYKKELSLAKESHYRKKISKLKSANPKQWFKWVKSLVDHESEDNRLEVENIKHLSSKEQAEMIASKFAEVSNEYEPLDRSKIHIPYFSQEDVPVFTEQEVLEVLMDLKVNKASRQTDIPARILKAFANKLSEPMTKVINNAIMSGIWPDFLKMEVVTPVPKVSQPKCIDDLRNISGLMSMNKVMEKLICKLIISDMKSKMDPSQYANQKGVSVDHYLIKMLDKILVELDKKGESTAVIATLVDWSKAFPRLDSTLGITSFIENGVRPSLIPIIISFFENRRMCVKWHGELSTVRPMPAGGSQGSTFGVLGYLSQSNDNADCVPSDERFKFMDDLSFLETVLIMNIGMATYNIKNHVPSNLPSHNQIIPSQNLKTQQYLDSIQKWTSDRMMVLNEKKTKSMIFNFTKEKQFVTDIKLKNETLEVVKETKLLGVHITSDLKWNRNTEHLVKDSNRRMRVLHRAANFTKIQEIC